MNFLGSLLALALMLCQQIHAKRLAHGGLWSERHTLNCQEQANCRFSVFLCSLVVSPLVERWLEKKKKKKKKPEECRWAQPSFRMRVQNRTTLFGRNATRCCLVSHPCGSILCDGSNSKPPPDKTPPVWKLATVSPWHCQPIESVFAAKPSTIRVPSIPEPIDCNDAFQKKKKRLEWMMYL